MNYDIRATWAITNLFYDEGYIYLSNIEPKTDEEITFRIRTEKGNVTIAYLELSKDRETYVTYEMKYEKDDINGRFSYFKVTIPPQKDIFKYRFRCENQNPHNTVWLGVHGITKTPPDFKPDVFSCDCWTMIPGFHTPDWAKGVMWYSVMPDGFYNGDTTNDEPFSGANTANSWNNVRHELADRYGGDLKGFKEKIPYLRDLGVEALYVNPVFKTSQNAGYGPNHYKEIENAFGNKQALIDLSETIHENGLRFIIDTVFSFVEPDSPWYNKFETSPFPGACQEWDSPFHEYFMFLGEEGDTKAYKSLWGGVELNHSNQKLAKEIYTEKDSYLPYYEAAPFNLDGIRYDTGGALYGIEPDGTRIGDLIVVGRMRPYLKAINQDFLMQSEYSAHEAIAGGAWDSRWNLDFVQIIQKYITGEVKEGRLIENIEGELYAAPRAVALCQYNALSDHDRPRNHNREPYMIRPAQMIQMTMLGAPCIFFGEEFNITREDYGTSFYSMNWNENEWDYETLSFIKSLIELRKDNTTLHTGIHKNLIVDNKNHILAFARQDENGTVITVASRNPFPYKVTIDAADMSETDGTLFTDWLTGQKYTVQDGFIELTVPAGGTILVKGDKSATNKAGFMMSTLGGKADITVANDGTLHVDGEGSVDDNFVFINRDVFNTCTISAKIKNSKATTILQIRNSLEKDCAFIGVSVKNGKATISYRKTDGGKLVNMRSIPLEKDAYIIINRDEYNNFEITTTKMIGTMETILEVIHVDMNCHAKAGFAAIGKAEIVYPVIEFDSNVMKADDFTHGKTAMFDYADAHVKFVKDGIRMAPENGYAEILSYSGKNDWTFKSRLKFNSVNGEAGIISRQDQDNFVLAGRKIEDGKPVFFLAKAMNGKPVSFFTISDTQPDRKATIQLQRTGATYSAVVSYDEKKWRLIGKELVANLTIARAGLYVKGEESAAFQYACFGDAINGGGDVNTPMIPEKMVFDFTPMTDVDKRPKYRIVFGEWSVADEGYLQADSGIGQMGIAEKTYGEFRVDGTYNIESGNGFVGFEFGKTAYDTPMGDGVLFALNDKREISLKRNGEVLATARIDEHFSDFIRLSVDYKGNTLLVCAGLEAEPVMIVRDLKVERGYISYFTEGVAAHINSSIVASNETSIYHFRPYTYEKDGIANAWGCEKSFASLYGIGVTDFVLSLRITPDKEEIRDKSAYAGVGICGHEGKFYENMALMLKLTGDNMLKLYNGNDTKKPLCSCGVKEQDYHDIMIAKKGKMISVYVDGAQEPSLTYEESVLRGGVISFYSQFTKVSYTKIRLENLQPGDEIVNSMLYRKFTKNV